MTRLHPIKVQKLINYYRLSNQEIKRFNQIPKNEYKEFNIFTDNLNLMCNTIYHSSNIEYEDELTIDKTKIIVKDILKNGNKKITNKNKTHTDILVGNMFEAYAKFQSILNIESISVEDIMDIHYELTNNLISIETPGQFRKFEATISGKEDIIHFTPPKFIKTEMRNLIGVDILCYLNGIKDNPYNTNIEKLDNILEIKRKFISIHPFEDGNGRMSRLLFQYLLVKSELPICSFKDWNRRDYHNGMHIAYKTQGNMSTIKGMYVKEILNEIQNKMELIWG